MQGHLQPHETKGFHPQPRIRVQFLQDQWKALCSAQNAAEAKLFKAALDQLILNKNENDILSPKEHVQLAMMLIQFSGKNPNLAAYIQCVKNEFGLHEFNQFEKLYRKKKEAEVDVTVEDLYRFYVDTTILQVPDIIPLRLLDKNGNLNITAEEEKKIDELIDRKIKAGQVFENDGHIGGRIFRFELKFVFEEKPFFNVLFFYKKDNPKERFVGYVYPKPIGKGSEGDVRVMMGRNKRWYVVKRVFRPTTEYKVAHDLKSAATQIIRGSLKGRFVPERFGPKRTEIVSDWHPGVDFHETIYGNREKVPQTPPQRLHPLFKLRACLNLFKTLQALHRKDYVHRDIKLENFILFGLFLWLIDLGFAKKGEGTDAEFAGTYQLMHPKALQQKSSKATDMYSAGLTAADILMAIDEKSRAEFHRAWDPESAVGTIKIITRESKKFQQLVDSDDSLLRERQRFPQSTMHRLLRFLRATTHLSIKPLDADESVSYLTDECVDLALRTIITAGVINLTEYTQIDSLAQKKWFAEQAKKYDFIKLVWSGEQCPAPLEEIQAWRDLTASRMSIFSTKKLFVPEMKEIDKHLPNYSDAGTNYEFTLITQQQGLPKSFLVRNLVEEPDPSVQPIRLL